MKKLDTNVKMTNGLASLMCIANQNKTHIKSSKPRDAKNSNHLNLERKHDTSHHKLLNSSQIPLKYD